MKYEKEYPNLKPFGVIGNVMRGSKSDHCHVCGAQTEFIDTDFECYICSDECADQLTWEFLTNVIK